MHSNTCSMRHEVLWVSYWSGIIGSCGSSPLGFLRILHWLLPMATLVSRPSDRESGVISFPCPRLNDAILTGWNVISVWLYFPFPWWWRLLNIFPYVYQPFVLFWGSLSSINLLLIWLFLVVFGVATQNWLIQHIKERESIIKQLLIYIKLNDSKKLHAKNVLYKCH